MKKCRFLVFVCIISIFLSNVAYSEVINASEENRTVSRTSSSRLLTSVEEQILLEQDKPVGSDIYVFPHELVIGLIVGGVATYFLFKLITKNRPLF
ncbi:MAG: hypothetical protein HY606_04225 [Planctomycetes bacterium]|nr:hypothetical protein [Planctomycetota bacterium]